MNKDRKDTADNLVKTFHSRFQPCCDSFIELVRPREFESLME